MNNSERSVNQLHGQLRELEGALVLCKEELNASLDEYARTQANYQADLEAKQHKVRE